MDSSWAPLLALFSIALLSFLSKTIFKPRRKLKLPPGPKPWPIIGNFNLLGSLPHRSLHSLSQKYGDLMLLKLGKTPVVIASSPEMAKQVLMVHDAALASRPLLAAGKHTSYNYSDMALTPYGPYWRQVRKAVHSEILLEKRLESSECIRIDERREFVSRLRSLSGKPVVIRDHIMRYTISSMSRTLFGRKYFGEPSRGESGVSLGELQGLIDEWLVLNAVLNVEDYVPWLGFADLQGYGKRMKDLCEKFDRFNERVIDDHVGDRTAEKEGGRKDMVDVLLEMAEDPDLEVEMTRENIKGSLQGLLIAGSDPSATTIEWAIHELLKHPRVIEKAKDELDRVIGRNRWVEETDLPQLPYINAIALEALRLHPIGVLLIPHYAIRDCRIAGYDIPKGTIVRVNVWSIGRDPKTWESPEEFLPERFVGREVNLTGNNFSLLVFGSGRRRCPGYRLGLRVVRATLANLLHGFEVRLEEGKTTKDVCMDEMYGLAVRPKEPLTVVVEPTLPECLY